jgi:diguanylate cyclase (GGDEF)-like protein
MKRLIIAFAIIVGWASAAYAGAPVALTTLHAVHSLTKAEASKEPRVAFEATVNYTRVNDNKLFVQDGLEGIQVSAKQDFKMAPGDRVVIKGKAQAGLRPVVAADSVTLLRHGDRPKPAKATFDEMLAGQHDCMLVTLQAVVHSADMGLDSVTPTIVLKMLTGGALIDAVVNSNDEDALNNLPDADVQITGVVSGRFDGKMQETGILLHISSLADVKILKHAASNPWFSAVTPMDEIYTGYRVKYYSQRTRVQGIITYYQPGAAAVLQNGAKSLWIMTQSIAPLRVGDQADATGFPDVRDGFLALKRSEIQDNHLYTPVTPLYATWRELSSSKHQFDLVSIEGEVVMEVRAALQDEYVLTSDGRKFSAIYHHPYVAGLQPLTMNNIALGSKVRVTGICALESSNSFKGEVPFDILMRTPDDIAVVARPSLLNVRNLILVVSLLLVVLFVVIARGWTIERKVRRQTSVLAAIEQHRSRILEDINESRPLDEILKKITELVSSMLRGAPCWCEIANGELFGNPPAVQHDLRLIREEIPVRSGAAPGVLFAALDPATIPSASEIEALSTGARLASLAIETRRLYTDLRRRSEFDRLTKIHNRFSLEKRLAAQVEEASRCGAIFGLIYIDLDKFKPINDQFGHHIGDLYLQEAAQRMKRQLREGDILARLGGDEFASLVSAVLHRDEVEEIAVRLERCFDEPFSLEGNIIHGSASVGFALYPENGVTGDSLLNSADSAMYAAKHAKRQIEESLDQIQQPDCLDLQSKPTEPLKDSSSSAMRQASFR